MILGINLIKWKKQLIEFMSDQSIFTWFSRILMEILQWFFFWTSFL